MSSGASEPPASDSTSAPAAGAPADAAAAIAALVAADTHSLIERAVASMSRPPFDAPPPMPPPMQPPMLPAGLPGLPGLEPELESMDLHMLREWLDESFSDNDGDGASSDASSDSLMQLLQQQQHSADMATAVLQQPPGMHYGATSAPSAAAATSSSTSTALVPGGGAARAAGGGAAGKRPRASEKRPRGSSELAALSDEEPGKKRSWPNQREELLYLRTKVCTLENELRELKAASRRQFSSSATIVRIASGDGAGGNTMVACTSPGSLWEQVANRQLDEKVRAEVENRKLRGMVESQIRLAKRLQQLLRKRQVWDGLVSKRPKFATDLKPEESKIYAFLAQKIHDRYPHLDAFFALHGLRDLALELRDVQVKYEDAGGGGAEPDTSGSESSRGGLGGDMFLEMKEVKLMPFDYRAADDAVWRCLKNEIITMHNTSATVRVLYCVVDNDENVLRAKVAVKVSGRGAEVELTVWSIWRRVSERARVVYAVETLAITGGAASPGGAIVQVKQSATAVIEPFAGSSAPEASIIKVYMRSTPSIIQDPSGGGESPAAVDRHPLVGMLTDVFIGSYHQNIEAMYKAVENMLLNDMLSGKRALAR